MHHGRDSSLSSISGSFNDSCSITSSGSPRTSPIISPYVSPGDSPRELLNQQFMNSMSLQPPFSNNSSGSNNTIGSNNVKSNSSNTFVHKLYNMVVDHQYQHLIAWNYTGSSFIVCNIMEFSRDVLPKHFKHNNFSSFVRQLNMYGFHKVNKSPRGHRTLAENQIWEFSHLKFIKDRPDLLDEIKRKSLETENATRRDHGDIHSHMAVMQASQSEMVQQVLRLQDKFSQVVRELQETKSRQIKQQYVLNEMMNFLKQAHGGDSLVQSTMANEINMDAFELDHHHQVKSNNTIERPPSIYITSHDTNTNNNQFYNMQTRNTASRIPPALTVQTQNLQQQQQQQQLSLSPQNPEQYSPALSAYHTALNTPISPMSPNPFVPDEDIPNITFNQHQQMYSNQQYQQAIMDQQQSMMATPSSNAF